ncbi:E3 ubiquitin-protein ligase mib1 [Bulinus truncatus]|nr:E3 ubiquitin-protein ligase mib1 [Bulinus truncatus]
MKAGLRVVRGPDWKWGNEDGGEGHLGTVIKIDQDKKKATVQWDHGEIKTYRAGKMGSFDLHIFDNSQIYVKHMCVVCDECNENGIKGLRWKCSVCPNYDLCSSCYNKDKHSLSHSFLSFKVLPRQNSQKCQAWGIFQNATVIKRLNWKGGKETHGLVLQIEDSKTSFRSQAEVQWANGDGDMNGHNDIFDLICVHASSGGYYYKSHLPVVGDVATKPTAQNMPLTTQKNTAEKDKGMIKPGIRVVRGPDWKWGNQDGGEGFVGTVTDIWGPEPDKPPEKCVRVVWDNGMKSIYRIGRDSVFDLYVLDNAPCGVIQKDIECNECKVNPIHGICWKCSSCFNTYLCSQCYHSDKHEISHKFWRYDQAINHRFKVPRRCDSKKLQSKGIFTNATVSHSSGWNSYTEIGLPGYPRYTAGIVNSGIVLSIKPWDATETANSAAEVLWANGNQKTYRVGYLGSVDLKFIRESYGGDYYPDHLPILGKVERSPCEFEIGDFVKCCFDVNLVKILQKIHGRWTNDMAQYITLNGRVVEVDEDGGVVVLYGDGQRWRFNQDTLTRIDNLTVATIPSPMESDVVKQVLELGFEKDIVQSIVLKRYSQNLEEFNNPDSLVNEILDSQKQDSVSHDNCLSQRTITDDAMYESRSQRDVSASTSSQSIEMDSQILQESQRIAKDNEMLRNQRECKVCMDKEACVAFSPCGHLMCCEDCCSGLQSCPMCRRNIESILRTYIS